MVAIFFWTFEANSFASFAERDIGVLSSEDIRVSKSSESPLPSVAGGGPYPFRDSGVPVRETLREAEGVKSSGRSFQCSFIEPVWWDWTLELEAVRAGGGGRAGVEGER